MKCDNCGTSGDTYADEIYRKVVVDCQFWLEKAGEHQRACSGGLSGIDFEIETRAFIRNYEKYLECVQVLDKMGYGTPELREAYNTVYTSFVGGPDLEVVKKNTDALCGVMNQHGQVGQ